ncbi:MAG: hypothetical protein V3U35_04870 [Candidatus Neomarinimicrobiota bacterium]
MMITTDTFTNFARRLAATQGFPYVVIAETPNPIRQLADDVLRRRAEGMLETIIEGLTLPADVLRQRLEKIAPQQIHPEGVVRAALPV